MVQIRLVNQLLLITMLFIIIIIIIHFNINLLNPSRLSPVIILFRRQITCDMSSRDCYAIK